MCKCGSPEECIPGADSRDDSNRRSARRFNTGRKWLAEDPASLPGGVPGAAMCSEK